MAKLTSGNLSIEIRFLELDASKWVQYEIYFLYKDQPMVQDGLFKRINEHWSKRSLGAFKANEDEGEAGGLIGTLCKALDTDEMQYYQPIEPDFTLAIYPNMAFPFMESRYERIYTSERALEEERQRAQAREAAGGKLSDDYFTIILMIDLYNFGDEIAYAGEGPALIMMPQRKEVQKFLEDYDQELHEFCRVWGLSGADGDQSNA
jgi:hypothetical protein